MPGKKKFYAVRCGRTAGVFETWDECKRQVHGFGGAVFKSFPTRAEADAFAGSAAGSFVGGHRAVTTTTTTTTTNRTTSRKRSASRGSTVALSSSATAAAAAGAAEPEPAGGQVTLYTDGSCRKNQNVHATAQPAGWGVVAVGPGDRAVAELYGPVVLDRASPCFAGAEVGSNNTGELTAIYEALTWLEHDTDTKRGQGEVAMPAVIKYDSQYAAHIATGEWKATKNQRLAATVQAKYRAVRARRDVRLEHVKGHSGHRWNDRADELANLGGTPAGPACQFGRWKGYTHTPVTGKRSLASSSSASATNDKPAKSARWA